MLVNVGKYLRNPIFELKVVENDYCLFDSLSLLTGLKVAERMMVFEN